MLSSALIVFREVFEIVLIVGIILAATRNVPNRKIAIGAGFGAGLAGSIAVAFFTGQIADMAEGMGQEYFNAGILFTAAAFIGWTLLWMKKHGREMKGHFEQIGRAVTEGRLPFFSLSVIIALAILREGSEIALFSYGMLATGQSVSSLITGSIIGLIGGTLVGTLLYMGLIKLSLKHFFQVTSGLLIVLVAGMMSQGIGFLTAAGAFENLSYIVWDSSWILSEGSWIGQSLGALAGYTARPTAIQLIVYVLTLSSLITLSKLQGKTMIKQTATAATLTAAALLLTSTSAHASKTVTSPYVEKGEKELQWKGGYDIDDNSAVDGGWKQKLVFEYGVTERWATEVEIEFEKDGARGADPVTEGIAWENKLMLTEPGEYFLDVGVKGELFYNTAGGADKVETKLLLGKKTKNFSHLANISIERPFGEDSNGEWESGAAWGSRYRYSPSFEPGFEIHSGFGEIGNSGDFNTQSHQIGPAFYGKLGEIKYDIGYLFGVSDAAPDGQIKTVLKYEW